MWVGEPIGVAKLEDVEIMSAMQNVRGLTLRALAAVMAIGQKMAPAAVLEINSVMKVAVRHKKVRTT